MSDESSNVIVSVIIPVHNAAEYIAKTLTTVLAQSLKEIEIILVNDSSTDNTLDIVNKIASEDSRVRLSPIRATSVAANREISAYVSRPANTSFSSTMTITPIKRC